jgi:hypothetical protein
VQYNASELTSVQQRLTCSSSADSLPYCSIACRVSTKCSGHATSYIIATSSQRPPDATTSLLLVTAAAAAAAAAAVDDVVLVSLTLRRLLP